MDDQNNEIDQNRPTFMDEQLPAIKNDIFEEFLVEQIPNNSIEIEKSQKPYHYRSTKNLLRRSDFKKILNSSGQNDRLIPSSIKNDSSRQNSERERYHNQTQNSVDSQSFRKSFKKKLQQSFSVSHTVRDSSSSFSERSDSKSSHNIIIPAVYKYYKEEQMVQEKKLGCNCKKSRCLKLYCQCFQKQLFCSNDCNCHGCGNKNDNKEEHKQAVIEALARNAHGFEEEGGAQCVQEHPKGFSLGVEPDQVRKGCKCKKTKCLKKYCECYQSGVQCTVFCRCEGCSNKDLNPNSQNCEPNSQNMNKLGNV